MPNWTNEQEQVIESREQNLLVSAAAGSGKTAVLVQRILDKILDPYDPIDIDRLLVVTFTNAAASSLREKIRSKLDEEAGGKDAARRKTAIRQISLLAGDHIETIDRFCREVVLDHADGLGIDPSFRIADEGERKLLQSDVVSQVIEEAYEDPDEEYREAFSEFADLYASGKTDEKLEGLILDFYEFSMSHEFPRVWRHECAQLYKEDAQECADSEWMKYFSQMLIMQADDLHRSIREGLRLCGEPGGPYHYAKAMAEHEEILEKLTRCRTMDEYSRIMNGFAWSRPGRAKKDGPAVDPGLEVRVKNIRDQVKKALDDMRDRYFFAAEEQIYKMRKDTARYMDVLVRLTDCFEEKFGKEKETRGIADFSDVAHWALKVLINVDEEGMPLTDENGAYLRTDQAKEYADRFREIYIDEYQDSNRVQEILLQSISRPAGRFMVGDMKQSIYRFRMADTGIFLEKEAAYSVDADAPERRIDLHKNFRSRSEVLDAVNMIFREIMRREVGGVEYDDRQELHPGYDFPEYEPTDVDMKEIMIPEVILAGRDEVPSAKSNAEAEAHIVAERILSMVDSMPVYDKESGRYRKARYSDITILLRTATGWAETFSRVLDSHGIPNRSGANTGYFDAVEVRTVLAYLNVLDNPRQDIPLAASLRSLIGGLDDEELSTIRTKAGYGSLYDTILLYRKQEGSDPKICLKLDHFLEMTARLRSLVKDTPIHILLWKIFDETGYEDQISASEGGRQKKANLELMVDMAIAYEQTSYRGLFHFVRYIEKLRKSETDMGQAAEIGTKENLVRIMTMHKSKGLEFPIVFVSGLNKQFNLQDAYGTLVLHEHLGAGIDWRDAQLRGKMPNRLRNVISRKIRSDSIGEELRVLYVAMTRAEQKLILTGCGESREKMEKRAALLCEGEGEKIPASSIEGVQGMMEWVLAAIRRTESDKIRLISGAGVLREASEQIEEETLRLDDILSSDPDEVSDPALHARLTDMLTGDYPYAAGRWQMPGKLSVSELKRTAYEEELRRMAEEEGESVWIPGQGPAEAKAAAGTTEEGTAEEGSAEEGTAEAGSAEEGTAEAASLPGDPPVAPQIEIPRPRFLENTKKHSNISGAEVGSAYHLVLADLDFTSVRTADDVQALLETMLKCDKIQKEVARAMDKEKIVTFLKTSLAGRMGTAARAEKLWREQPFVIGKPGDEIRSDWSGEETVLIQGIIDAYFIEDDSIVLVDYKSDRAKPGEEESLVRRYRMQFQLYRDALERLLQMKVKEAWLYSLTLGKALPVDLSEEGPV